MTKFTKTRHANLVRSATGTYFVRAKVGGRLIRASLHTDKEWTALVRRDDRLKRERESVAKTKESRGGRMLMMDCIREYLFQSAQNRKIKKRTKDYHMEAVKMIRASWKEIDTLDAARVTGEQCKEWAEKLRVRFSPTRYNGALDTLRGIFAVAVKAGARLDNPASEVERLSVPRTKLSLPTSGQFQSVLAYLDGRKSAAKFLVRVLAYTGMRIDEARQLEWRDVDKDKCELHIRFIVGERNVKNNEERRIPIIPELIPVLDQLHVFTGHKVKVLPIGTVKNVLKISLKTLGVPHFTHHDCRHLFATRCIESGVDIPTVAKWLGHKDGGALAMKVYGHLRDDHSQAMAAKVKF